MAWNGSQGSSKTTTRQKSSTVTLRGILAGFAVMLVAIGAMMFLFRSKHQPDNLEEIEKKPAKISDLGAGLTKKAGVAKEEPAKPEKKKYKNMSREEKLAFWQERYGDNPPENLKATIYFLRHPSQRTFRPGRTKADVFEHVSERVIAAALTIEPGAFMLEKPVYDSKFDQDFANHVVDKITINEDDPDDVKELKQSVIDVKADMAERVKEGELPSQIMNKHMEAMYELGKYKSDVEELVRQYRLDASHSDQDVQDFVSAANKMLRDKGASEIAMPKLFARQAMLRARARKQKAKENQQ